MTSTHLHDYTETSRNWLAPQKPGGKWREMIAYRCRNKGCPKPHIVQTGRTSSNRPPEARDE